MTASIASARIDGLARPPDASSPLPSGRERPRSSSCATSASVSALTTDGAQLRQLALGELRVLARSTNSVTTKPSTESPRNSSRSFDSSTPCSAQYERCVSARSRRA